MKNLLSFIFTPSSGFLSLIFLLHSPVVFGSFAEAEKNFRARKHNKSAELFYSAANSSGGSVRDKALFGLAESLKRLDMPYGAAFFYSQIASQGSRSSMFRSAIEQIAEINSKEPLGRATINQIFRSQIEPLSIPPAARGFYFFYRGLNLFDNKNVPGAKAEFERVPSGTGYFTKAQYYLGVINALTKDAEGATTAFQRVLKSSSNESIKQLALMNLARVAYERKDYKRSLQFYSRIPRSSDLWLQSLLEGAWAFFMLQKHNNTLGNTHTILSPFFVNRFYPESYILNAITFLRLCRYDAVRGQLKNFQERYKPTFSDLNNLLRRYRGQNAGFYNVVARYKSSKTMNEFQAATEIIDSIGRSDAYKEASVVVKNLDNEKNALSSSGQSWQTNGLSQALRKSYDDRRSMTIDSAGGDSFSQAILLFRHLKDLSDQTRLINLEMLSGKTDELRAQFNADPVPSDGTVWGEGMKPLNLTQSIEYWPFKNYEYWDDELGGYVYGIASLCGASKSAKAPAGAKKE